jgi:hypothetical protein
MEARNTTFERIARHSFTVSLLLSDLPISSYSKKVSIFYFSEILKFEIMVGPLGFEPRIACAPGKYPCPN